jgi:hypothetical protein
VGKGIDEDGRHPDMGGECLSAPRYSEIASTLTIGGLRRWTKEGWYEVALFIGADARQRVVRYADQVYGDFDEIGLDPYAARS